MVTNKYLKWLSETASCWWNDSAVLQDMDEAINNGATGVTTNPILVSRSLYANDDFWRPYLQSAKGLKKSDKVEEIIRCITVKIASKFLPIYETTGGQQGYVCAQVDPTKQSDTEAMVAMGKRLVQWAPNIALKLPATKAGLDAIEELAALGYTTVGTVSFTTPQAVEIARRQQLGIERAKAAGIHTKAAFSVIMVGRLDDYLRDVIRDNGIDVNESDIIQAGTACIKNAYRICRERGYASQLLPAGMRGAYHAVALSGAEMTMSLSSGIHTMLCDVTDFSEHIDDVIDKDVLDRLMRADEFRRAYEPAGMAPEDFITYGATQRTLTQFVEAGWKTIEAFEI